MNTSDNTTTRLKNHFLAHQHLWQPALLIAWGFLNTLLLATTSLMEIRRHDSNIAAWEPFCWEASSTLIVLLSVWPILRIHAWLQTHLGLVGLLVVHALLTLPFSLIHVSGMVGLRELVYWMMGSDYNFGDLGYELLYEYRKDAMTYLIILLVGTSYQFIVRRLQGEASYMDESETSSTPLPDRLLVKKLGKEFLVAVSDIRWVEASGNYANLHVKDSVYPMRITLSRLESLLPRDMFIRIHRSLMVNLGSINHIQPTEAGDYGVFLHTGEELTLSRRYRDAFKAAMGECG